MSEYSNYLNRIEVSNKSLNSDSKNHIGYDVLTESYINNIIANPNIKHIQISKPLPAIAFKKIDQILHQRPDISFRIYRLEENNYFDLSCLSLMKNIKKLFLEGNLNGNNNLFDFNVLCNIDTLQDIHLNLFDLKDYSFVKDLSPNLEKFHVFADTMGGNVILDCEWLLKYQNISSIYLGKKAKKHVQAISSLPKLENLILRGIKVSDFDFLHNSLNLSSLSLHWCSMQDLSSLCGLNHLKCLELWRVMKLHDLSVISELTNLEQLKLIDLKHIHHLPDLSKLEKLNNIKIDNVPLDLLAIPDSIKNIIHR